MTTLGGPGVIPSILASLNRETLNSLDLTRSIAHPGENGRAREEILRRFVRRLLPSRYAASTGFVFDSGGNISRQVDLVIYRTDYAPTFEIGGVTHFMAEVVAAVIEVKEAISREDSLLSALDNIASVKRLDRSGGGQNRVLSGAQATRGVDPEQFNDQIFGAVVTESSLERSHFVETMTRYLRNSPRREWVNFYADVRGWHTAYGKPPGHKVVDPDVAEDLMVTTEGSSPSLIRLAQLLLDYLRVASLIDFIPGRYLPTEGIVTTHPIFPRDDASPRSPASDEAAE